MMYTLEFYLENIDSGGPDIVDEICFHIQAPPPGVIWESAQETYCQPQFKEPLIWRIDTCHMIPSKST